MRDQESTREQTEPPEVMFLREVLCRRATSAEFNEWQAREIAAYIDRLKDALGKIELMCLDAAGVEIEDIYGVVTDALHPDRRAAK